MVVQMGLRVGYFDWELDGGDHRVRLDQMFGPGFEGIKYVKCDRPLTHEVDRLKRVIEEERLDYAICDSVAFACDGPPESAEVTLLHGVAANLGLGR
jgi:hypothetical protein